MCHIILTLRHKSDSKAPIIAIDGAMMFCGILRIIRGESASAEDVFTYQLHVAKQLFFDEIQHMRRAFDPIRVEGFFSALFLTEIGCRVIVLSELL